MIGTSTLGVVHKYEAHLYIYIPSTMHFSYAAPMTCMVPPIDQAVWNAYDRKANGDL
jgi:hypothetical protein